MAGAGEILKFITCGSVDDGKSTLIGHLLHRTGNIPSDQMQTLIAESVRIGTAGEELDYSLLMDGLLAEREQGITIDVAYRYFSISGRKFIVADTPGHEQYTRNMATGASHCDAALILVDAQKGISPQTRRHTLICALMGISHILFVVNKMDCVEWAESAFRHVETQKTQLLIDLEQFGLHFSSHAIVPVSALYGDNLTEPSLHTPWHENITLLTWLMQAVPTSWRANAHSRLPVQYVLKIARDSVNWQHGTWEHFGEGKTGTFRAYAGTLTSGRLALGDQIVVQPSGTLATVERIWSGNTEVAAATGGMAVALSLSGEHDIVRGDVLVPVQNRCELADLFKVRVIWMDEAPLFAGRQYLFRSILGTIPAEVVRIKNKIEPESCHRLAADCLQKNDIAELELRITRMIPFDSYAENRETGSFLLIDRVSNATACCGTILHAMRRSTNLHWQTHIVDPEARCRIKGQRPSVIWLTGLSGSGKSTIANALESRLNGMGKHTMLLDGDNVRHGLNKDLGFTDADRIENIRRIGEVAKLMVEAGLIVITAFISPFREERAMVRAMFYKEEFIEIYISTPLEECERRDPKGLYSKARAGLIPNFTGINSPYEPPQSPNITIDTRATSVSLAVESIIERLILN